MAIVVGIDEVGRGCWAGPLVAAAVVLSRPIKGLKDSKLLAKSTREQLAIIIHERAKVGLGWVTPAQIDRLGLTASTTLAMKLALSKIGATYDEIVIDGNLNFLPDNPRARAIIKADMNFSAVSAASIVAKVARDDYMRKMAKRYPAYQFERHVGYGTKLHHEMLKLHGACDLHRMSYKPLIALTA